MGRIAAAIIACLVLLVADGLHAQSMYDSARVDGAASLILPHQSVVIARIYSLNEVIGGKLWAPDTLAFRAAQMGNITDALATMPSMSLKTYAPGGLATPTLRGTGAGHTQVYWDGLPLTSSMLGQQDLALGATNLFAQMEAYYGGNSLMMGSGGIGGAIGLTSLCNPGYPYRRQLKLRQQVGSFGSMSSYMGLDFGTPKGNLQSSTNLYLNTAKNNFPFRNTAAAGTPLERLRNAGVLQFGGMQQVWWYFKRYVWSAKLWILDADRSLPATMLSSFTDESQQDQAIRGSLSCNRQIHNGALTMRAGYFREWLQYQYPTAGILALSNSERIVGDARYDSGEEKNRVVLKYLGLRYVHDQAKSDGYVNGAQQDLLSAAAKGRWKLSDNKLITLLVRQEMNDWKLSPVMAFLGAGLGLPLANTALNVNLSRNYRYPSLNDRYWQPGGNPNLRPELSHAAELNVVHRIAAPNAYRGSTSWEVGGYWNHVDDWILWIPGTNAIWHPENVRKVNAMGLEVSAKHDHRLWSNDQLQVQAGYTWSSTRDQDRYQLIYTPQHNGYVRVHFQHKGIGIQYFQSMNSRRYTTTDNVAFIKGFTMGDVNLSWQFRVKHRLDTDPLTGNFNFAPIRNKFLLQAGMRNLWNAQYQTVAWRPMPGRSIFLRLDWTFSGGIVK